VPFAAIDGFFDPSVQFGLQFELVTAGEVDEAASEAGPEETKAAKPRKPVRAPSARKGAGEASVPAPLPAAPEKAAKQEPAKKEPAAEHSERPSKPVGGGGEVVRLDRFRKK
jgi:hypothetical protein